MLLPDCVDGPAHENRKHFHAIPPGDLDAIAASKVLAIALGLAGGPSGIEGAANQIRFEPPPSAGCGLNRTDRHPGAGDKTVSPQCRGDTDNGHGGNRPPCAKAAACELSDGRRYAEQTPDG